MAERKPILVHLAGLTDVGLVREHNEDNLVVVDLDRRARVEVDGMRTLTLGDRGALLVVCDGMGGAAAGEVASQMAVDTILEQMTAEWQLPVEAEERLADFARRVRSTAFTANERIHEAARTDHARAGMGTTMTAVGLVDGHLITAQVGDSRAYVLRAGAITQVTRDQSLVNSLLEAGQITLEEAARFEHQNVILQALGVQEEVEVQLSRVALRRGDRVLVCSDGLNGVVSDEEMGALLGDREDAAEICRLLVEMARSGGGPDNITAIVARVGGEGLPEPAADEKVVYQRWRLDEPEEEPAPPPREAPSLEAVGIDETDARDEDDDERPIDRAQLFLSSMLLLAIALVGVILASLLHKKSPSVACVIGAPTAGLRVRVDGRDVGVRTTGGRTELRLAPGRHRLALSGDGGARWDRCAAGEGGIAVECAVEVVKGAPTGSCEALFDAAPR